MTEKKIETSDIKEVNLNNNQLTLQGLIDKIQLLSEGNNPYSVSKEIEEIKSIFYNRINAHKKEIENTIISNTKEKLSKDIVNNKDNQESKNKYHPLEISFKISYNSYKKLKKEFRNKKINEEQKNLEIKKQIIKDIDILSKEEESLKITFEKFRLLQKKWNSTGYVPITENNNIWQSYQHHVELFYDYIKLNKDLRDLDFKRNFEEKIQILKKAKKLLKESSINIAHKVLQELHEHWKNVGPVEREQRDIIWKKFQSISKEINTKRNDYFLTLKQQNKQKLENKNLLCKKIDDLYSFKDLSHKDWEKATAKCKEFEEEWRKLGNLNRDNLKVSWKNLRTSLDNFYNAKREHYKNKKIISKKIIENKLAICKQAEKLKNSTDWHKTAKELMKLQEEWKNFPHSSSSNEIWNRFRLACNTFFNARKEDFKNVIKLEEEASNKKKKVVNKLKKIKLSESLKKTLKELEVIKLEWKNTGKVTKRDKSINDEFYKTLELKYEKIGLSKIELDNIKLQNKIDLIGDNKNAILKEKNLIKMKIDSLKKDILQYENNISFFGHGNATEKLLLQTQNKISNSKTEIASLYKKIQMLNKA